MTLTLTSCAKITAQLIIGTCNLTWWELNDLRDVPISGARWPWRLLLNGFSEWSLIDFTRLAPRILKCSLDFRKNLHTPDLIGNLRNVP